MTKTTPDLPKVEVKSRAEWRRWLTKNHGQEGSIWLVTYKKSEGPLYLDYDSIVEEALCFGWVDSRTARLDERRTMLLLSPRRKGSAWSQSNKTRVERLTASGLLEAAGQAAIARAKADGTWDKLNAVEALIEPADLLAAFAKNKTARRYWDAFPRSARRGILEWIGAAKRAETRAKRIDETVHLAAQNVKANFPEGRNKGPEPVTAKKRGKA